MSRPMLQIALAWLVFWGLCSSSLAGPTYDSWDNWEADGAQPDAGVWYYQWAEMADLDGDYTTMTDWSSGRWEGRVAGVTTDPYPFIAQTINHPTWREIGGAAPDKDVGSIRTFVAPIEGPWHLTGYFSDVNSGSGNGVLVGIFADEPTGDDTPILPFTHIDSGDAGVPNSINYDLNVVLEAGQKLFFRTQSYSSSSSDSTGERHNVEFIPEPTTMLLLCAGAALLAFCGRRRRR